MMRNSNTAFMWGLVLLRLTPIALLWGAFTFLFVRTFLPLPITPADRLAAATQHLLGLRVALRSENAIPRMQAGFPEGGCFVVTLYALSWTNLLIHHEPNSGLRALAISEVNWALTQYDTPDVARPFVSTQVRRGIFWLGQRNLVLAQYLKSLPPEERPSDLVDEFNRNSESLHREFLRSPTGHLDAYPGLCWPADNITALASLHVHDELFHTRYRSAFDHWKAWTKQSLDPSTLLPAGHLDSGTGALLQPSRGCANSWILALLPQVDPELSATWYEQYRQHHMVRRIGYRVFREYPKGVARHSDVDSGPIVWGAGATATGVGLAASIANGDLKTAEDIHGIANAFGSRRTIKTDRGPGSQYLFGMLPVGDAFLTWAYTLPLSQPHPNAPTSVTTLLWQRKAATLITLLLTIALLEISRRVVRRTRKTLKTNAKTA